MADPGSLVISGAMRAVFDAVSDGVAVFDAERKVVYLNRKAQELLGWAEREAVGHRCREVLDTSECDHNCPLTRLMSGGERANGVEMVYDGRDGRSVEAESSFEVIRDEKGSVVGSVEVFRDLREIRDLKE